ncbi:HIT family protein [Mycoplasmopsis californica HAZ160_1]|uniref:HIT family protein n=1 Tax=Mycoplasmopsis californica HAZ160_1 TaxID=1397850 RepID=A0AAT9F8U8_9BACT|nr:HIT family protein [Mycoplasmopsis californica]BAP01300.1 HIT family protein [Mycoplasmopsis californica HAZ160_1]BBG41174.1 HIT family protein [Mycoplasmopsis californica]BBG41767.1 HIT family protein [Mycoplasmopsis californica]BBG42361.1 HIT family protein [Mycoplasmopsis californica]BBG42936.1 HIT family protein [Mycoplasmopsis californica]
MDNIFLDIIAGKAEAQFIYKDEKCVAFYDKFPFRPGHFLVVPREKTANITEMDDNLAGHLINVARKLAKQEILDKGIPGFKIVINTGRSAEQSIFHTHIHVIPFK